MIRDRYPNWWRAEKLRRHNAAKAAKSAFTFVAEMFALALILIVSYGLAAALTGG